MKYYFQIEGLLRNNIGDVLQGMVAKPFLPEDSNVVDREELSTIDRTEKGFLIANGWYMHSFENFPPPQNITPLYISVHIANSKLLLDKAVRDHFLANAPIGCRDKKTLYLFWGWGIPAYYSGCLTVTTIPRKSSNNSSNNEVLLVDNVDHPIPDKVVAKLKDLLGKDIHRISHDPPDVTGSLESYFESSQQHMNFLLEKYCSAEMVITSKIHCALPCLGMGAKVLFIHPNPSDPRLETLREFMQILSYDEVLGTSALPIPKIDTQALAQRQNFLTEIVNQSVNSGCNIMRHPNSLAFKKIKYSSILMAKLSKIFRIVYSKIKSPDSNIRRVYG